MALIRKIEDDTVQLWDGSTQILAIREAVEGNQVLVVLQGMLRSDTVHDLNDELMALTTLGMDLTVDMAEVKSICAASQHVLLRVQQKMDDLGKGSLQLQKLPAAILEEFEKTGLSELLDIT